MAQNLRFQVVKQGGPTEVVSVPKPAVESEDEVLVKLKAVALQPIDWKMIDFGIMVQKWPHTMGLDGAGVVEQVGSGVTRFKPGDEVYGMFIGGERGVAYQEYAVIREVQLGKKPANVSFEDAASLSVGYVSALCAAWLNLGIPFSFMPAPKQGPFKPNSILVLGGSSAVGSAAIQLLRVALPDATILTTSSSKHHNLLATLGANKVFERSASPEEIRAATPSGKGVDAIFDAVNAVAIQPELLDAFDPSGSKKIAELLTSANMEKIPDGLDHSLVNGGNLFGTPGLFEALDDLMAGGKYKVPIATKVVGEGVESIGKGIDELRLGVSGTKLVVKL